MSEEKFPSQEDSPQKPTPEDMEGLEDELEKADKILMDEGLLKGVEEEESQEVSESKAEEKETSESETAKKEAKVESKESPEEFNSESVKSLIESGASDEEIWEKAKEEGVFPKPDGSSYYLSEHLSDPEAGKYYWRRRSAAGNTSGDGYRQKDMFENYIQKALDKYREKMETEDQTELELTEESESPEITAEEQPETEPSEPGEAKKTESTEEAPDISVGDPVYLMEGELQRWRDPKLVKEIDTVRGQQYAEVEGGDGLYPLDKLKLDPGEATYKPEANEASASAEDFEDTPMTDELADVEGAEEIDESVAAEFESQFEISAQDLIEKIPGFTDLSAGQQQLVLNNFRQLTLGRIEEEGIEGYREDKASSNALAGMWKGFMSSYYKNKHITETGKELLSGGIDIHKEALADVVQSTKESGLDLDEEGELVFARPDDIEDLTDEERAIVEEFNEAAQSFAQTAVEWEYEDGWSKLTGGNREAYQDKRNQYSHALQRYINLLDDHKGLAAGLREGADIDKKVRFAQFFAGNSKYEDALQNIKDDASWKQLLGAVGREKGSYMAMGMASRTSAVGLINLVAAPIVATGIGGAAIGAGLGAYKGRRNAVETLEDDAKLSRGGGQEQSNLINTVPAEQLTDKLRSLMDKVEDPDLSKKEREEVAASLSRRIRFTEQKINGGTYVYEDEDGNEQVAKLSGGLVDYGDVDGRSGRQYQLLQTLNEARALGVIHDLDVNEEINNRLDRYLDYKDEKTRSYVKEKTKRGAVYAGAFGGVLGTLAGLGIFGGDDVTEAPGTDGIEKGKGITTDTTDTAGVQPDSITQDEVTPADSVVADSAVADTTDTTETAVGDTLETTQPDTATADTVAVSEVPTPPEVTAEALGPQSFTIDESGEGMIHAIADKLEADYDISHEKAMDIGNKLYIKGEQMGGNDEMFNLVGKGSTFELDFGDLTPEDLQSQSSDELVKTVDFDQADFDAGDSGVEPAEELPATESGASATDLRGENPIESVKEIDDAYINEEPGMTGAEADTNVRGENPIERVKEIDDVQLTEEPGMTEEEVNEFQKRAQEAGVTVEDSIPEEESVSEASDRAVEAISGDEKALRSAVDKVTESHIRAKVVHSSALLADNSELVADLPETRLNVLGNLLERYAESNTTSETILKIAEDDPRLLTVLERALTADHIDGEPLSPNDQNVLAFVRHHVSQLSPADFAGEMPDYVLESMEASRQQ